MDKKMNENSQHAWSSLRMWRYIAYFGIFASVVLVFVAFIYVAKSPTTQDVWDKIDIVAKAFGGIAGVLIPAVIAWGIHVYNKGQRQLETTRQSNEFRLRQLDVAHEFLPQFLSKDTAEKWAALGLIRMLGDEDLANKIARWLIGGYWRQENRELIERLMKDADLDIAELAAQAFRSISSPPIEVRQPPSAMLRSDYMLEITPIIPQTGRVIFKDNAVEQHGRWVVSRGQHELVLPAKFRMGIYLVTNEWFLDFIKDDGYTMESYWSEAALGTREKCLSQDGRTFGPST